MSKLYQCCYTDCKVKKETMKTTADYLKMPDYYLTTTTKTANILASPEVCRPLIQKRV